MSHHTYHAGPVPEELLGTRAIRAERIAGVVGIVGLALCVFGFIANRSEFFQSYLFAFVYWAGFALGGLGVLLMNNVVGGKWGVSIRRLLEAKVRTLPLIFLLFLPILFGLHDLYPWARPEVVSQNAILQHKAHYLNVPFFAIRLVIYFAIWLFWGFRLIRFSDEQDRTADPTIKDRMRRFSAPGLLIFVMAATFAYIDWVLSTDSDFYSTIYGGLLLIGDVLQTFALSIIVLVFASREDRFHGLLDSKLMHDLGNLMFAFTIFWTYLSLSQLIIIWPANLPQEINWYLLRVRGGWSFLAAGIAIVMFLIPFLALLSQERKRNPARLVRVAVWLLCARIVDLFWIVEPTYRNKGLVFYWTDVAAFAGIGGVWLYVYLGQLRRRPLLPLNDPRLTAPVVREAAV